ncbi:MAG: VIT1/CCC1 transporter family protein [Bacteroidales bacterium]
MANKDDTKRYIANWNDELNGAMLYEAMAKKEKDSRIAGIYSKLAETERLHAKIWETNIQVSGGKIPVFKASWRTRTLILLADRMGIEAVLPTISGIESTASNNYIGQPEALGMAASERGHAILLSQIKTTTIGGIEGGLLARLEGRHRSAGGNALRAAVLGASDGLLSNFNLIMGVAGAAVSQSSILLTGFAGLLAGSISMALGEWISVQSSRELYKKQIATEAEELENAPEEEIEELSLIYQARGLNEEMATKMAQQVMANKDTALDALVRDELGLNPEDLGGSAWEAAITSFILFAIGAIIPLIPYFFLSGKTAIAGSAIISCVGLFGIGSAITLFTGRSVLFSGSRQILFGLAAAAVSFLVGHLIGVSIAG